MNKKERPDVFTSGFFLCTNTTKSLEILVQNDEQIIVY